MKKVKITVMRKVRHDDLIEKYENPLEHECTVEEGEVFIANGWVKPDDFCDSMNAPLRKARCSLLTDG